MNTIRSTWYGWATLCVAGGGAYYFAKQQINADRAERYNTERKKQERLRRLEYSNLDLGETSPAKETKKKRSSQTDPNSGTHNTKGFDHAGSPSTEASEDAAPVGHAPETTEQRVRERSKYEAAEPFRSKKGDRFS